MLIRVMYRNSRYDMVKDYFLENLIARGGIKKFFRSGGWVEVGRDPVRGHSAEAPAYTGPERRDSVAHRTLETPIRIGRRYYRPFPPDILSAE